MANQMSRNHYWYTDTDVSDLGVRDRAVAVLEAVRNYRVSETAMRRRTRRSMDMGENELAVVRHLLRAKDEGRQVTPTDIARYLGVSTASTTAILDRLERGGHVRRDRHPTDRRRIHVVSTAETDREVRATLGRMHERMMSAVAGMDPDQSQAVVDCLTRLAAAIDEIDGSDGSDGSDGTHEDPSAV